MAESIKDVLRYTVIFPESGYSAGVRTASDAVLAQGNTLVKFNNSWKNSDGYRGINAVYETPQGFKFEVQFHTEASYHAKETLIFQECAVITLSEK